MEIAGDARGTWFDHEANEGGGVLDLLRARKGLANGAALAWLEDAGFLDAPPPQSKPGGSRRIVAAYDYRDAAGDLLFQVVRFEPKDFRQRRPDGKSGWDWSVKGTALVPYRLPDLLRAAPHAPVFIVEGEKDADALRERGLVATTNPGGVGKWRDSFNEQFRGRHVVILPDNDPQASHPDGKLRFHPDGRPVLPGQDHAADVARRLEGIVASVRVLQLPDLPPKGDVSDWLARGGTAEELEDLVRLPPATEEAPAPDAADGLLWFDDIQPVLDARDFVQGVLVEQGAAVVYGESNAGKTFWVTDLALHVAAGKSWNGRRIEQGGVIYCALEGGIGFRNRVVAWRQHHCQLGDRVHFAAVPETLNLRDPEADTPRLIAQVKAAAARMGQPMRLIVIDTLSRALAGGNENASDDMGALVRCMDLIRQETGACVLLVHHSGKDAAKGARGHSLLRAAIDTEIEVKADDATGMKSATVVKQRDLTKGGVFGFRLDQRVLGQNQHGEDVTTCVVVPEEAPSGSVSRPRHLTDTQRGWLRDLSDMFAPEGPAKERVPAPGMASVLTLTRDEIRAGYRKVGRVGSDTDAPLTGAEREKLRTMLNALKDRGKIGLTADLVWLL